MYIIWIRTGLIEYAYTLHQEEVYVNGLFEKYCCKFFICGEGVLAHVDSLVCFTTPLF